MVQTIEKKIPSAIKSLIARIDWKCLGAVAVAFIVTRLMIVVVTYFSMVQIPMITVGERFWRYNPNNIIPDALLRWDSGWFLRIVHEGYVSESTPFFPLYPLLMKVSSLITGNSWTSGLWVSNIAFLIALVYLYAIAKHEFDDEVAGRTVFYLASAPAAFFFSTAYSESIFLLFLAASMYYAIQKKWLLAGIAGGLASATRLPGVLIAIFILLEAFWQQGIRLLPKPWSIRAQGALLLADLKTLPKAWKGILAGVFSASGLAGYMVFLWYKFGDPLMFLHAEQNWNKHISLDWLPRLIQNIYGMHQPTGNIFSGKIGTIPYLMDSLAFLVFLPVVIIVLFKFRPSYAWFTFLSFLMPVVSGSPISMRRYVLGIIPCYLLLAVWGKRPWVDRTVIGISLPLQAFLLILFSHWVFAG